MRNREGLKVDAVFLKDYRLLVHNLSNKISLKLNQLFGSSKYSNSPVLRSEASFNYLN